jgi:hypothetical protein
LENQHRLIKARTDLQKGFMGLTRAIRQAGQVLTRVFGNDL